MFEKSSTIRARYREQAERRAFEQGFKKGFKQGWEQARTRTWEAFDRFGVEVNGVRMLPDTPEVQRFLDGEEERYY